MNNTRKACFAFTGPLALAAVFAAAPAFADGECQEWNVTGTWRIAQSNGTNVILRLQQTGVVLQGVGEYSYYSNVHRQPQTVSGPITGQLEHGRQIRVSVYWSNGAVGLYVGEIQADGQMIGFTSDRNNYENRAKFVAGGNGQCVLRAAVAPPPPAKPTMALGRVTASTAPGSTGLGDKPPPVALGRVPITTPPDPTLTICDHAKSARERNSPAAPGLERQCTAYLGAHPVATVPAAAPPVAPAAAPVLPVPAPAMPAPPIDPNQLDALAAKGAEIAGIDPAVDAARGAEGSPYYQLGFDIATGLFGDPILGAEGLKQMDPISTNIRNSLSSSGQRGFDASAKFHLARMNP